MENNQALFNLFLDFPKPILIAVNGPALGASVTSATLCDGIIASDKATFSTPFAALGVTPEGCSSVQFARLMGEENAERMLGREGWRPGAEEVEHAEGWGQAPRGEKVPDPFGVTRPSGWPSSTGIRSP